MGYVQPAKSSVKTPDNPAGFSDAKDSVRTPVRHAPQKLAKLVTAPSFRDAISTRQTVFVKFIGKHADHDKLDLKGR